MAAENLTDTTIRYLFASTWAPPGGAGPTVKVPGAVVDGPDTADDLLNLAIWSLREQGLVEVEQIRPFEQERVQTLGGKSFVRVRPLPGEALKLGGLEGALLAKAREKPGEGALSRLHEKVADLASVDDELGARNLILQLEIGGGSPWGRVVEFCFKEAEAAGLVEKKGRVFKKPVISDPAGVEALKERDAEIVAARTKYREKQQDLDHATIADCIHALNWAHSTSSSDF